MNKDPYACAFTSNLSFFIERTALAQNIDGRFMSDSVNQTHLCHRYQLFLAGNESCQMAYSSIGIVLVSGIIYSFHLGSYIGRARNDLLSLVDLQVPGQRDLRIYFHF